MSCKFGARAVQSVINNTKTSRVEFVWLRTESLEYSLANFADLSASMICLNTSKQRTRNSAQGNCSAKSLAPGMSSILPCPPCLLHGRGVWRGRGIWQGEGGLGRGQGTFHPPCHILHDHMVLRPKGTSHNKSLVLWSGEQGATDDLCHLMVKLSSQFSLGLVLSVRAVGGKEISQPIQLLTSAIDVEEFQI